ncbi:MAG TPA: hypothetical protein VGQ94_00790 [Terriglobales bacterium]|nr:hypothetical protein [Terriglobales bacterium]
MAPFAQAQLKEMPSQAEFDPILDNADSKLKAFVATLTEFRVEAAAMDKERLDTDLKDIRRLQQMIQATKSGTKGRNGINMQRLVVVLGGIDDFALEAATWKSLAELRMCQLMTLHQDPSHYDQFGVRVTMNLQMLREVGGQLFHPTLRMAVATDEIMFAVGDAASKGKARPH